VGRDPGPFHGREGAHRRDRDGRGHDQSGPDVAQQQQQHDDDKDDPAADILGDGVDRLFDQFGSIVGNTLAT
ncbi:MAG: hypothetical protein L0H75_11815, partial [Nitrosospira sp.]|nr:hypothetical protein [Nitrosospira sp.]